MTQIFSMLSASFFLVVSQDFHPYQSCRFSQFEILVTKPKSWYILYTHSSIHPCSVYTSLETLPRRNIQRPLVSNRVNFFGCLFLLIHRMLFLFYYLFYYFFLILMASTETIQRIKQLWDNKAFIYLIINAKLHQLYTFITQTGTQHVCIHFIIRCLGPSNRFTINTYNCAILYFYKLSNLVLAILLQYDRIYDSKDVLECIVRWMSAGSFRLCLRSSS